MTRTKQAKNDADEGNELFSMSMALESPPPAAASRVNPPLAGVRERVMTAAVLGAVLPAVAPKDPVKPAAPASAGAAGAARTKGLSFKPSPHTPAKDSSAKSDAPAPAGAAAAAGPPTPSSAPDGGAGGGAVTWNSTRQEVCDTFNKKEDVLKCFEKFIPANQENLSFLQSAIVENAYSVDRAVIFRNFISNIASVAYGSFMEYANQIINATIDKVRSIVTIQKNQIKELKAENSRLQTELATTQNVPDRASEVHELETANAKLQTENAKLQKERKDARDNARRLIAATKLEEENAKAKQQELEGANILLAAEREKTKTLQEQLAAEQTKPKVSSDVESEKIKKLKESLATARGDLAETNAKKESYRSQRNIAKAEIKALKAEVEELKRLRANDVELETMYAKQVQDTKAACAEEIKRFKDDNAPQFAILKTSYTDALAEAEGKLKVSEANLASAREELAKEQAFSFRMGAIFTNALLLISDFMDCDWFSLRATTEMRASFVNGLSKYAIGPRFTAKWMQDVRKTLKVQDPSVSLTTTKKHQLDETSDAGTKVEQSEFKKKMRAANRLVVGAPPVPTAVEVGPPVPPAVDTSCAAAGPSQTPVQLESQPVPSLGQVEDPAVQAAIRELLAGERDLLTGQRASSLDENMQTPKTPGDATGEAAQFEAAALLNASPLRADEGVGGSLESVRSSASGLGRDFINSARADDDDNFLW